MVFSLETLMTTAGAGGGGQQVPPRVLGLPFPERAAPSKPEAVPQPALFAPPRILIVRLSSVRGVLLTTPLVRALHARHANAEISVITRREYAPLLSDNPHVHEVIGLGRRFSLSAAARHVRAAGYTHRLDLEGSARSRMLRVLARGRWRGYSKGGLPRRVLIRTKRSFFRVPIPMAERYFTAARDLDVVPDGAPPEFCLNAVAEQRAAEWLAQAGIGQGAPVVAFAPGASRATRRWPPDYWVALLRRVVGTGADAVLVGDLADAQLCSELALRAGPRAASAAGVLTLQGTGALLKRTAALITGDTGVLHMATGVGTPVVALFGPTVRQFGYFPYNAHGDVLERDLPCRPCASRGGPRCPLEHHLCMRSIKPEDTFNVLCRILSAPAP